MSRQQVVLASSNAGKLRELQQVLQAADISVVAQHELGIESVAEDGLSFVENAIIKARHACRHSGLAAIADDSGLAVDVLHGAPGIYSARYAGENASDYANNAKLLHALEAVRGEQRRAWFRCSLVFMRHALDPIPIICEGGWRGEILHSPQGNAGFGYDPIFFVPGHQCSAAELPPRVKNQISHRGQALQQLTDTLASLGDD